MSDTNTNPLGEGRVTPEDVKLLRHLADFAQNHHAHDNEVDDINDLADRLTAALAARREPEDARIGMLHSCPWCGLAMKGWFADRQMGHVIGCGDVRYAAARAPSPTATAPAMSDARVDVIESFLTRTHHIDRCRNRHGERCNCGLLDATLSLRSLADQLATHARGANV